MLVPSRHFGDSNVVAVSHFNNAIEDDFGIRRRSRDDDEALVAGDADTHYGRIILILISSLIGMRMLSASRSATSRRMASTVYARRPRFGAKSMLTLSASQPLTLSALASLAS